MGTSEVLAFHIAMGTVGLLSGSLALYFKKGSPGHRSTGNIFFGSMSFMAASGILIALMKTIPLSVLGGSLALYLVVTGWAALQRRSPRTHVIEIASLLLVLAIAIGGFSLGMNPGESENDRPGFFVFGAIASLYAIADLRMLNGGGVSGVKRIVRHLSRMCVALLVAAISIFLGNPQVFADAIRESGVLFGPPILIAMLTVFWLFRVRRQGFPVKG